MLAYSLPSNAGEPNGSIAFIVSCNLLQRGDKSKMWMRNRDHHNPQPSNRSNKKITSNHGGRMLVFLSIRPILDQCVASETKGCFMNLLESHQIQWPSEVGTGGKHLPTGFTCQNHSKHFNINILSQKPVETRRNPPIHGKT